MRRAVLLPVLLMAALATSLPGPSALQAQDVDREAVRVGSKNFGESYLLAEIFAQLLEARGMAVERRLGLGATEIVFQALRTGAIDVYPEYTGTGLLAILGTEPPADAGAAYRQVSAAFRTRYDLRWLPPLGFENTYAIAVRPGMADSLQLTTLSDLAAVAGDLTAGFTPDFIGRADGLPGLRSVYGIDPGEVRSLLQAVKYEALVAGDVDVIDGYATDGRIARYDLRVLEDDRGFFPPYDAAPLATAELVRSRPEAVAALGEMAGLLDEAFVRGLNAQVEVEGAEVGVVARDALRELGLVEGTDAEGSGAVADGLVPTGGGSEGLLSYLWARRSMLGSMTLRHLVLVGWSLGLGILLAVPLGLLLERRRGVAEGVIRGVGLLQTIPSIALLAFMIPLLGIGVVPAVVALLLYSLFPIVRNTYTGVRDADPDAVAAARALGMTELQLLGQVRLPLAAPVIMAGIRTAAVINVGTATLAAFIGAGGLGDPIVAGLALSNTTQVLSGALPAAALALLVDAGLAGVERAVTPQGVQEV